MKVILSGGGTGGHIYPALAIGTLLKKRIQEVELLYVGTSTGLEADIVPKQGMAFKAITVEGLPRRPSVKALRSILKLIKGMWESKQLLKEYKPDLVIATGGYVCGPVAYWAARMNIKLVIHEQNALPGLTNKLLAKKADLICVTFEESLDYFPSNKKVVVTGLPVRPEIITTTRKEGAKVLGIDPSRFIILVTGGSRGARSINKAMIEVIKYFKSFQDIHLIHVTGKACYEGFIKDIKMKGMEPANLANVTIKPYLHGMQNALACADLVVGRAGATFLAEITAKGIPAVLVPYPHASENHQEANADSLVNKGAALKIKDKNLNGKNLLDILSKLVEDRIKLQEMANNSRKLGRPDAGEKIVQLICEML